MKNPGQKNVAVPPPAKGRPQSAGGKMLAESSSPLDWNYWLNVFLDDNHEPPVDLDSQPVIGEAVLDDSEEFTTAFLEFVAEKTEAFPSLDSLEKKRDRYAILKPPPANKDPEKNFQITHAKTFLKAVTTPTGYRDIVNKTTGGSLNQFLATPRRIYIDERKRRKHSFVAGSSGSGKSIYLTALIHSYITRRPGDAIVVIDPHAQMAEEIARIPDVARSDRLVYLDPGLFRGWTPTYNPFVVSGVDPDTLEIIRAQFLTALATVLSTESEPTDRMVTVLEPVLKYLFLRDEPSSLEDLMNILIGTMTEEQISILPNPNDRAYLRKVFTEAGPNLSSTLSSIQSRLQQLLTKENFRSFLCARENSFDLESLLAQSKVIIFSLKETSGNTDYSPVNQIGRLVFASLLSIVAKKDHPLIDAPPLPPIHLFVDEAHAYTIPTVKVILDEARKYGLHLTLATQSLDNFTDVDVRKSVKKNTFLKWVGFQPNGVTDNAPLVGVSSPEISSLGPGCFWLAPGDLPKFKVRGPSHLIWPRNNPSALETFPYRVPDAEWAQILDKQKQRYYREISKLVFSTPGTPATDKRAPNPHSPPQTSPQASAEPSKTPFQTFDD